MNNSSLPQAGLFVPGAEHSQTSYRAAESEPGSTVNQPLWTAQRCH